MPAAENNKKSNNAWVSLWGESTGTSLCLSAVGCIWQRAGFWGAVSCRPVPACSLRGRCRNPSAVQSCVHTQLVCVIGADTARLSSCGERGVRERLGVLQYRPLPARQSITKGKCAGSRRFWGMSCCRPRGWQAVTALKCRPVLGRMSRTVPAVTALQRSCCSLVLMGLCAPRSLLFMRSKAHREE